MLGPICKQLGGSKVILASGSPRRRQILENVVSQRRPNTPNKFCLFASLFIYMYRYSDMCVQSVN